MPSFDISPRDKWERLAYVVISVFLLQSACDHRHFSFHNRLYGGSGSNTTIPGISGKSYSQIYTRIRPCLGYESTKAPASGTSRRGLLVWLGFSVPDRGDACGGGLFLGPLTGLLRQCLAAGGGGSYPSENPVTDFILVPQLLDLAGQSGPAFGGAGRRDLVP